MTSRRPLLLENRDYTVRSDGSWVFTREYLLARGTCCGSRCMNCPYEFTRATPLRTRPVISFVPSWTETLIHAGAHVIGRTRFCVHPADAVKKAASFGGTKTLATDVDSKFQSVLSNFPAQRPLVILDREENPKEFFEHFSKLDCDIAVTHVRDLHTLASGLETLAVHFSPRSNVAPDDEMVARQLLVFRDRTRQLVTGTGAVDVVSASRKASLGAACLKSNVAPAEIDRLISETSTPILYFIWRDPWMVVSHETWIGETLKLRFQKAQIPLDGRRLEGGGKGAATATETAAKYPVVREEDVPPGSLLLFSSEPFPFERAWDELLKLDFVRRAGAVALVDGECFSWFGIRAIRFLEER